MSPQQIIDAVIALDPLSELPRTGWLLRGVQPCESIADHSHGVTLVAMMLVDGLRERGEQVDGEKVLRMAVVHDAPEAATGDIPMPHKTDALDDALGQLEQDLAARLLPPSLLESWRELERGDSLEARIVKAADKLHMMIKATVYTRHGRGDLGEFWQNDKNFDDRGIALAREAFDLLR